MARQGALSPSAMTLALGMSSPGDGIALTRHLIDTAVSELQLQDAQVLEVFGHYSREAGDSGQLTVRPFSDSSDMQRAPINMEGLAETISRNMSMVLPGEDLDQSRMLLPVSSQNGPMRVVVLDGIKAEPHVRILALHLVELYKNQIRLMDSRERDHLTGLMNRQTFARHFELALHKTTRESQPGLWLGIVDIDHFKKVNDTYGHLFGDEVLLHLAQQMESCFRYTDHLFRFGGEEFIVLLSANGGDGAARALERLRHCVERHEFPGVGNITVSIGYASCEAGELPTSVIDKADQALYRAKANGRNGCVNFASMRREPEHGKTGEVDLFQEPVGFN